MTALPATLDAWLGEHHGFAVVLAGTTVLGIACGAIGTFLLLRKRSLVADALSHAALPGVCAGFLVATALGGPAKSIWVLLPSAALFSLLGVACVHLLTTLPRVREEAAIGVVLSVFFAAGIVGLSVIQKLQTGNQAGLKLFIFGQAATMATRDARMIAIIAVAALALLALLYKELRLVCFDAGFARGLGRPVTALDALLLALATAITVAGLYAAGAILMVALLIIPPAAARFWTTRLLPMIVLASAVGGAGAALGTVASATLADMPTGPAIVVSCGSIFAVSMLLAPRRGLLATALRRLLVARTIGRQHLLRALWEEGESHGSPGLPVGFGELLARRSWSPPRLRRQIRRLLRRGEIAPAGDACVLTESGRRAAARIVRTHRLWEFYLTTHADIAPSHVDHCADDIEHVLGDELVERLEAALRRTGALEEGAFVPRSPHLLADAPGGAGEP